MTTIWDTQPPQIIPWGGIRFGVHSSTDLKQSTHPSAPDKKGVELRHQYFAHRGLGDWTKEEGRWG